MELLTMTARELDRIVLLQQVQDGSLSQVAAAATLALSERQVRRLVRAFERGGPVALISQRRGKTPNNRLGPTLRSTVLEKYQGNYRDFGPTLLAQTLAERDDIRVSREWLRHLLIEHKLWKTKRRRRNVHPLRERRSRFGELVQMDGSPHDWFEERGPRCTLLLAIDDATSRITAARFDHAETTDGYFGLIGDHLKKFGRFCAAYTDKHSIFRYGGTSTDETVATQLQRALDELDIDLICANSPQAKGRIERANRTFQDRLIKTMRLEGIADRASGNAFLPRFLDAHNARFAIEPASDEDAHRVTTGFELERILCRREERVVTKNLMFQVDDDFFALVDPYSRLNLAAGSRIEISLHPKAGMSVRHGTAVLEAHNAGKRLRNAPIVGAKDLNARLDRRIPNPKKAHVPVATHPWRRPFPNP